MDYIVDLCYGKENANSSWTGNWNMQVLDGKWNQFFNGPVTEDLKYTPAEESRICQMIILKNIGEDVQHTVNTMRIHNEWDLAYGTILLRRINQ